MQHTLSGGYLLHERVDPCACLAGHASNPAYLPKDVVMTSHVMSVDEYWHRCQGEGLTHHHSGSCSDGAGSG